MLLVIDVSGSMGDAAGDRTATTKLDLAKQAAIDSLDQFKDDDEVGLRVFTTEHRPATDRRPTSSTSCPSRRSARTATRWPQRIDDLVPLNGTPLYRVTAGSRTTMRRGLRPGGINAVVLLTDGRNEDGDAERRRRPARASCITSLRGSSEGENSQPVRVFPIAYGKDADLARAAPIAEATNAAAYDASDPTTINQVFTAVVSNF